MCEVRESREPLDCVDRTRGMAGDTARWGASGGVLDSLREDQRDESVDLVRFMRSSMASRVCCEMAEIASSNVSVWGMWISSEANGVILLLFRGGEETGKTARGEGDEVPAGGDRATAVSRKEETACAARFGHP